MLIQSYSPKDINTDEQISFPKYRKRNNVPSRMINSIITVIIKISGYKGDWCTIIDKIAHKCTISLSIATAYNLELQVTDEGDDGGVVDFAWKSLR